MGMEGPGSFTPIKRTSESSGVISFDERLKRAKHSNYIDNKMAYLSGDARKSRYEVIGEHFSYLSFNDEEAASCKIRANGMMHYLETQPNDYQNKREGSLRMVESDMNRLDDLKVNEFGEVDVLRKEGTTTSQGEAINKLKKIVEAAGDIKSPRIDYEISVLQEAAVALNKLGEKTEASAALIRAEAKQREIMVKNHFDGYIGLMRAYKLIGDNQGVERIFQQDIKRILAEEFKGIKNNNIQTRRLDRLMNSLSEVGDWKLVAEANEVLKEENK